MTLAEYLRSIIGYNRWANERILIGMHNGDHMKQWRTGDTEDADEADRAASSRLSHAGQ